MRTRLAHAFILPFLAASALASEPVELESGEILEVSSAEVKDGSVILDHPILGTLKIPLSSVRSINGHPPTTQISRDAGKTTADGTRSQAELEQSAGDQAGEQEQSQWQGAFTLAGSINDGTSRNSSLFTQLTYGRDTMREKTTLTTFYRFASSDGRTNQSWYNLTGDQLWKLEDSKWGIFADGQFDWSEFNSWEQRIAAHAGGQYALLNLDKKNTPGLWFDTLKLDGRIGAGPRKEFAGITTDLVAEGELGALLSMSLAKGQTIEADATYYPTLDKNMEYRFESNLNWTIPLHMEGLDGLSLALGVKYQYQSKVSSEDRNYNLLGTVGVKWAF